MLAIADLPPPDNAIVQIALPPTTNWKRCMVSVDGGPEVKVYFDNFSHQNKKARGWASCIHGCTKYDFCFRQETRSLFCAALLEWARNHEAAVALCPGIPMRKAHLAFRPDADSVVATSNRMVVREF